jgi:hypothetical protein
MVARIRSAVGLPFPVIDDRRSFNIPVDIKANVAKRIRVDTGN